MLCILNGMETWTLKKKHMHNLEAFEMQANRRILRIGWMTRITNPGLKEDKKTKIIS